MAFSKSRSELIQVVRERFPQSDCAKLISYFDFVLSCTTSSDGESHHLLPKSIFPEFVDTPENLVQLSYNDHFWSHYLLALALPKCKQVQYGFFIMVNTRHWKLLPEEKVLALQSFYVNKRKQFKGVFVGRDVKTGEILLINNDDPRFLSGEVVHPTKGTSMVRDSAGNIFRVPKDDPRIGIELEPVNKGMKIMRDKQGNTIRVPKDDPRIASGDLVSVSKGRIAVKDAMGNTFSVYKDDLRYISGELVGVQRGAKAINKTPRIKGSKVAYDVETGKRMQVSPQDPRWGLGEITTKRSGLYRTRGKLIDRIPAFNTLTRRICYVNPSDTRFTDGTLSLEKVGEYFAGVAKHSHTPEISRNV
jgi:hypothetical protein